MFEITTEQRRIRLARRHGLAPGSGFSSVVETATSLVGLHASDPAAVYLGAWARCEGFTRADLEAALYEQRSLVRILGMRRTMFVVPLATMPLLDVGCARQLAAGERRRTEKLLREAGITDEPGEWLAEVESATMAALAELGPTVATELTKAVPGLGVKILFGQGKKWAGLVGMSTRVLFLLATEGRILRTRPRGTWLSSQYRWDAVDSWLGRYDPQLSVDEARAALADRYLARFGPATETDVAWWTGWTKTAVRKALAEVGAVEVSLEHGIGYVLQDDIQADEPVARWVALLPNLDSTVMGWKQRDWFLGPHAPRLFDTNGNAGPTVWVDGRVVGAWAQDPTGEVVFELVEAVDAEARAMIERRVRDLTRWFDGQVVKARFPSPLQRELASS